MTLFQNFILSLVEGLTEFLPVSSTGHLILTQKWLGLQDNDFVTQYNIIIQFGAILSVLVIYRHRFLANFDLYKKLLIAFLPAAIIGLLVKSHIDKLLRSDFVVAVALILGGIILMGVEKFIKVNNPKDIKSISVKESLKIGFMQCFAFVPGVSRSAATIVGGLIVGLSKESAAEFSFFLAVPTLAAASLYKLYKIWNTIHAEQIKDLSIGFVLSFLFALLAIKFFIKIVGRHGFFWFGLYRVIIGTIVLLTL